MLFICGREWTNFFSQAQYSSWQETVDERTKKQNKNNNKREELDIPCYERLLNCMIYGFQVKLEEFKVRICFSILRRVNNTEYAFITTCACQGKRIMIVETKSGPTPTLRMLIIIISNCFFQLQKHNITGVIFKLRKSSLT